VELELTGDGPFALLDDTLNISEDEIDRHALHSEPRATIDPLAPTSRGGDRGLPVGPSRSDLRKTHAIDVAIDIQPQIEIRIRMMSPARSTSPERDSTYSPHRTQISREGSQIQIGQHDPDLTPITARAGLGGG
jgi:hypothetical protein